VVDFPKTPLNLDREKTRNIACIFKEGPMKNSALYAGKVFLTALAIALLIAGQILAPAAASAIPSKVASSESCGSTYTVKAKDNLTKIAAYCETTVAHILALNPQITNANLIYTGQVLRITGSAPTTTTDKTNYSNSSTTYETYTYSSGTSYRYGYARVSLSTTTAQEGDEIMVYISGFPPGADIDYRVGQSGYDYTVVYDSTVDSDGTDEQEIVIPSAADKGEYWVVKVMTTSHKEGVTVTSHTIYINN
jgi:LysM repeat protein